MACEEKQRLTAVHKKALEQHTLSSNDLYMVRGRTSKVEYDRLLMATSEAMETARITFQALTKHTGEHGC
jgi:hypothetical protein